MKPSAMIGGQRLAAAIVSALVVATTEPATTPRSATAEPVLAASVAAELRLLDFATPEAYQ